ncbi:hypothetical protein ACFWN5_39530, partial [Streptomyces sp. NPDC058430]|uniref:hypothetical protein n=1 Tax=Streptomyces sp. NPDC058430 TaxID=3346495 RepID=UPI003654F228
MRIEILDVLDDKTGEHGPDIVFSTPAGRAWARWLGSEAPRAGDAVDIEIDVPDDIENWALAEAPDALLGDAPGAPVRLRGVVVGGGAGDPRVGGRLDTPQVRLVLTPPDHPGGRTHPAQPPPRA